MNVKEKFANDFSAMLKDEKYALARQQKCFHETGHIVLHLMLGDQFIEAGVSPDLTIAFSHCESDRWESVGAKARLDEAKVGMAGMASEMYFMNPGKVTALVNVLRNHECTQELRNTKKGDDLWKCRGFTEDELADVIEKTFTEKYFEDNRALFIEITRVLFFQTILSKEKLDEILAEHPLVRQVY